MMNSPSLLLHLLLSASWLVGSASSLSLSSTGTSKNNWINQLASFPSSLLSQQSKPIIVCTTAPSLEGMAFCQSVIDQNQFQVRALARNVNSPRAQALRDMGCEVVYADNLNVPSLQKAFQNAHGVYAITTWSGSTFNADGSVQRASNLDSSVLENSEIEQGRNIIQVAETVPLLQHFILQSMHRGGREFAVKEGVKAPLHHRAKWEQEDILQQSSLPCWSILRQPTYLENFDNDDDAAKGTKLRLLRPGVVSGLLDLDVPLTVIAVKDLGAIASKMFESRSKYTNRILRAGCERVTGRRLANSASRVNGNMKFEYQPVPWFVLEYLIPVDYPKQLKKWLTFGCNDEGIVYDDNNSSDDEEVRESAHSSRDFIKECYELHPNMMSVDDWLRTRGVAEMEKPKSVMDQLKEKTQELIFR